MEDSNSLQSARAQSRATIWAALIGCVGVIAAAWIGLGVGRSQGKDKGEGTIIALQQEISKRDAESTELQEKLRTQQKELEEIRRNADSTELQEKLQAQEKKLEEIRKQLVVAQTKRPKDNSKLYGPETKSINEQSSAKFLDDQVNIAVGWCEHDRPVTLTVSAIGKPIVCRNMQQTVYAESCNFVLKGHKYGVMVTAVGDSSATVAVNPL
jgi:TolA-binding protein